MTVDPRLEPHDLLAAYLLDAVEEDERARFEQHLLDCPGCEREIEDLTPAVTALALSAPAVPPPPAVRERVLGSLADQRGRQAREAGGAVDGAGEGRPADALAQRRAARSSRRLFILTAAAAAVAVVMALTFGPFRAEPEVTVATIAAAADAERYQVVVGDATATIIVSRSLDRAAIETTDMDPAPEGRDYQIWFNHEDGSMTDAGLMPHEPDAAMVLSDTVGDAVGVGITLEPAGGSPEPTGEPIVLVPFEA